MKSRYETNIALQPELIGGILNKSSPSWFKDLRRRRVFFVGIGSSYFAGRIAEWLWRRHVSPEAYAVGSYDFVRMPQPIKRSDAVVLFSHSGAKSYTLEAGQEARKRGALTIGITCLDSPWKDSLVHRLETCEREDTGAFTKSLTTALAWVVKAAASPQLLADFKRVAARIDAKGFPRLEARTDVVLIGDTVREWVAREIVLKLQEAATLPARAFGLEEFLHGPRVSTGPSSLVVGFTSAEPRWDAVRDFLNTVDVPFHEVSAESIEAGWLSQLYWGQRLGVDVCKRLGVNPDALRTNLPRYKKARANLTL